MKPIKTFLFLACTLIIVAAVCLGVHKPNLHAASKPVPNQAQTDRILIARQQAEKEKEEKEAQAVTSLIQRWEQDSMMLFYKQLYRLEADIFEDAELRDVPVFPFEYDSTGAGKYLLQDFFAKLLALRNPLHAEQIADWYEKPDFWNEDLTPRRTRFVRVLHYGGSLIENDYVSGTLRRLMQEDFGGAGVGLLPLFQTNANFIAVKKSGKWHISQPNKKMPDRKSVV